MNLPGMLSSGQPADGVSRTGMTRDRWEYLKGLGPKVGRYLHVSASFHMMPNPLGKDLPLVPVATPKGYGETYNVGRNKAKRERRALHDSWGRA